MTQARAVYPNEGIHSTALQDETEALTRAYERVCADVRCRSEALWRRICRAVFSVRIAIAVSSMMVLLSLAGALFGLAAFSAGGSVGVLLLPLGALAGSSLLLSFPLRRVRTPEMAMPAACRSRALPLD